MFDEFGIPWRTFILVMNLISPFVLLGVLLSTLLNTPTLVKILKNFKNCDPQLKSSFSENFLYIISFCVVGCVIGVIIRLMGGFAVGSGGDGNPPDFLQFSATIATSFASIAGSFIGERKINYAGMVTPTGTGALVFSMLFGYLFFSKLLAH